MRGAVMAAALMLIMLVPGTPAGAAGDITGGTGTLAAAQQTALAEATPSPTPKAQLLDKEGFIEALGLEFDPNFHSAIAQEPSEGEPGRVLRVVQKGYSLGDRVVRPSMVIVSAQQTASADEIDAGDGSSN